MTVDFQAPNTNTVTHLRITILAANPGGSMDELLYYLVATNTKQYSNVQQVHPNSTTTFAGITWHVATLTATYKSMRVKEVDMVGQSSSTGKVYYLTLHDTASTYNQTNNAIFQPMLQSLRLS